MRRMIEACVFALLIISLNPHLGFAETVVVREVESYFYADGKMEKGPGQFEHRNTGRSKIDLLPSNPLNVKRSGSG